MPPAPGTPASGIGGTPERPGFRVLAQDDDPSFFEDPSNRTRPLDGLKIIDVGDATLSLGALAHVEPEYVRNPDFGAPYPVDDGFLNFRLNVYAALSFGERLRLFGAIKSGAQVEQVGSDRASEEDVDLHMAFAELRWGDLLGGSPQDALIRIGRQELAYGSARQFSTREEPNLRRDWDAVIVRIRSGQVTAEAFAGFDVEERLGAFNNETVNDEGVWGVYATMPGPARSNFDVYYLAQHRLGEAYVQGQTDETRHLLGARYWTSGPPNEGLGLDLEAALQVGRFRTDGVGGGDVRAWTVSALVRYGWPDAALSPVITASAGANSGDEDPSDGRLQTFRPPAPPGRYFGKQNVLGPGNIAGFSISADLTPVQRLTISPEVLAAWRVRTADGIYSPGGMLVRSAAGARHFIGFEQNITLTYQVSDYLTASLLLAHFSTGEYIDDNEPSRDLLRLRAGLVFQF
jgi:hypothetical protein